MRYYEYVCIFQEQLKKTIIARITAEIRTGHLPNRSQKGYCLRQLYRQFERFYMTDCFTLTKPKRADLHSIEICRRS
jgi:predicted NACHT family NTPase